MNTISPRPLPWPPFSPASPSSRSFSKHSSSGTMLTRSPPVAVAERSRGLGIRVVDVAKGFGAYPALHGVDLDLQEGDLLALLGPSGSGKTTLLRIIAGLEQADRGRVFFGERDATQLRVQDRRVGFVFQNYALF